MTFSELQKRQRHIGKEKQSKTFKEQLKNNKIKLNNNDSRILQRITSGFLKQPINTNKLSSMSYKCITNLEQLQLIKTKVINQNTSTIKVSPTKLGQEIIKQSTNQPLKIIYNKLKHKDKIHKITKPIEDTCATIIFILLLIIGILGFIGSNCKIMWTVGCIWCVMIIILILVIFGYVLPSDHKLTPIISVKQIEQIYEQNHNQEQSKQYQEILQNINSHEIYEINTTNPANQNTVSSEQCFTKLNK